MKCRLVDGFRQTIEGSPSMRREWIEIVQNPCISTAVASPSMRREWIEIACSSESERQQLSPSMRREWIEIPCRVFNYIADIVSLHAEGVD